MNVKLLLFVLPLFLFCGFSIDSDDSILEEKTVKKSILFHASCEKQYFPIQIEVNFDTVLFAMDTLFTLNSEKDSILYFYNKPEIDLTVSINGVGICTYYQHYKVSELLAYIINVYNYNPFSKFVTRTVQKSEK